jgi:hypothetical protein
VFLLKNYPMSMVAQTIRDKEWASSKILPNFYALARHLSGQSWQSFGGPIAIFIDWIKH